MAGAEGFEPPSSVLETDSLTVELTPLYNQRDSCFLNPSLRSGSRLRAPAALTPAKRLYLTSRCGVCLRHFLQNLLNSRRSVVVFRFFVVE